MVKPKHGKPRNLQTGDFQSMFWRHGLCIRTPRGDSPWSPHVTGAVPSSTFSCGKGGSAVPKATHVVDKKFSGFYVVNIHLLYYSTIYAAGCPKIPVLLIIQPRKKKNKTLWSHSPSRTTRSELPGQQCLRFANMGTSKVAGRNDLGLFQLAKIFKIMFVFPTSLCGILVFSWALPRLLLPRSRRSSRRLLPHKTHTHNLLTQNLLTHNLGTHNLLTHNLSTHNLSTHTTYSHTQLAHTPLVHTQLVHTHLTHKHTQLTHTQLVHTQLVHIPLRQTHTDSLLTHNLSTHNLSTYHFPKHTHTQLTHTQLVHTRLVHIPLPHTQLTHTQLVHTQLTRTQLAHT